MLPLFLLVMCFSYASFLLTIHGSTNTPPLAFTGEQMPAAIYSIIKSHFSTHLFHILKLTDVDRLFTQILKLIVKHKHVKK